MAELVFTALLQVNSKVGVWLDLHTDADDSSRHIKRGEYCEYVLLPKNADYPLSRLEPIYGPWDTASKYVRLLSIKGVPTPYKLPFGSIF
jgi:hypothetical protein